jgi:pimeloyl-ACP methyl ester carboxylesterase
LEIHHNSRQKGAPEQPQRQEVSYAKLATIGVPTLILAGDQDLTTPTWAIRTQAEHIPGAQLVIVPEVAHDINWEKPEVFNGHVLPFLAAH